MSTDRTTAILGLVLAACGAEPRQAPRMSSPLPLPTSVTTISSARTETTPVSPSIAVDEEIARACTLSFDDVTKAPKFAFDKSELLTEDLEVLRAIAHCVTTGPLAGRSMKLVGRADPRGTEQYNMALGARRAHGVATFLQQFGVDEGHLRETSRGELDAMGKDERSWQVDRRVDVLLSD